MRSGQKVVDYIEYVEHCVYVELVNGSGVGWEDYEPSSLSSVQRGVDLVYREEIDVRTGLTGLQKLALMWDSEAVPMPRGQQKTFDLSKMRMSLGVLTVPVRNRPDSDPHADVDAYLESELGF